MKPRGQRGGRTSASPLRQQPGPAALAKPGDGGPGQAAGL